MVARASGAASKAQKTKAARAGRAARSMSEAQVRAGEAYFRSSGTVPPDAIIFAITCLCSQMFISAEPSSAPV